MAFLKFADCKTVNPIINANSWFKNRIAKTSPMGVDVDKKFEKANKVILKSFPAKDFLFSHCTIMSSLNVDENDFYITPDTAKMLNANGDGWETRLLKQAYKSFRGAYNYLEHYQVPAEKKGWIVDAFSRDVTLDSGEKVIYIDILVATERKHKDLVAKIENGSMHSMSMGCKISYSICSKCGNKAIDESQLCEHIKYLKGNTFYDDNGVQRVIGELCGHRSDPESVSFIEASWVADPAFKGAVKRNFLPVDEEFTISEKEDKKSQLLKVANQLKRLAEDEEETTKEEITNDETTDDEAKGEEISEDLDNDSDGDEEEIADEFYIDEIEMDSKIINEDEVREQLAKFKNKKALKYVLKNLKSFKWNKVKSYFSPNEKLAIDYLRDKVLEKKSFFYLYPVIKKAGNLKQFENKNKYFERCSKMVDRKLNFEEKKFILIKAKIYNL